MASIMTARAAFGLEDSEAKTEIMCRRTKHGDKVFFNVTAAGQGHKRTAVLVHMSLAVSAQTRISVSR